MTVMKFGGSVLQNPEGFQSMLKIIKENEDSKLLIVVSAFAKSTRNLKLAATMAEKSDLTGAVKIIEEFVGEYKDYSSFLFDNKESRKALNQEYDATYNRLKDLLKGISITKELTNRTLDAVLSFGEQISLITAYHYLKDNGVNLVFIDSSNVVVSDDNYGYAKPILEKCSYNIRQIVEPALKNYGIVITQGFVARSEDNEITTMGLESSNLTAALYAAYLDAEELTIWTDVEGIRNRDPKLYDSSSLISCMSYEQAYEASLNGLKIIFPDMMEILKSKSIKLLIKSAYKSNGAYTLISEERACKNEILILEKSHLTLYNLKYDNIEEKNRFLYQLSKLSNRFIEYVGISKNSANIISEDCKICKSFIDMECVSKNVKMTAMINYYEDGVEILEQKIDSFIATRSDIVFKESNNKICKIYNIE
jgi:aspartate kinase